MSEEIYTPSQPLPAGALEPAPAADVPAAFQSFMDGEVRRPAATVTRHAATNATPRREVSSQGTAQSVGDGSDHGYSFRAMAVSPEDQAGYDAFGRTARAYDLTQRQFEGVAAFHRGYVASQNAAVAQAVRQHNAQAQAATVQELQAEWGEGYAVEIAAIEELYAAMPTAMRTLLMYGDVDTGERALNSAPVLRWLAGVAHGRRGGGSPQNTASTEDEMFAIEALMGDKSSPYWKGPRAARLQARYLQLQRGR